MNAIFLINTETLAMQTAGNLGGTQMIFFSMVLTCQGLIVRSMLLWSGYRQVSALWTRYSATNLPNSGDGKVNGEADETKGQRQPMHRR